MISVLVVEDELPILRSTCTMVERLHSEFKVLYRATNGKEALEIIEKNKVDFIVLDIQMPIMTGVELLRIMNERKILIPTVVLSGYQDFSYVRDSLRFGAVDYILKPLKKENLEKILREVEHLIWDNNSKKRKEQKDELAQVNQEYNYEVSLFVIGAYQSDQEDGEVFILNQNYELELEKLLKNQLPEDAYWIVPTRCSNEKLVVFRKLAHRTEQILKQIYMEIEEQHIFSRPVTIILSKKEQNHDSIYHTNVELHQIAKDIMLLEKGQLCIDYVDDVKKENRGRCEKASEIITEVAHPEQIMGTIRTALEQVERRSVMSELLNMGFWRYSELFEGNYSYGELEVELTRILENSYSKDTLYEELEKLVINDFYQKEAASSNKTKLAIQMKEYIEKNYRKQINNQRLSEKFGYVSAHLRDLFRKQYQMSPMDYLQNIRIRKSKELLDGKEELALREIAEIVGFNDPLYFSKVFRKNVGMSPSQYRKRNQEDEK